MRFQALFGEIAVALSHLRSTAEGRLFDDQKAAIDKAVQSLKDAEDGIGAAIAADVQEAVKEALSGLQIVTHEDFTTTINDLGGRVAAVEQAQSDIGDGLIDLRNAVTDVMRGTDTETDTASDTLLGGQGNDSIEGPAADDGPATIQGGAASDTIEGGASSGESGQADGSGEGSTDGAEAGAGGEGTGDASTGADTTQGGQASDSVEGGAS